MKSPLQVKQDIPFLRKYSFWESTAVGPTLKPAIDAIVEYCENHPFNFLVGDCQPALEANVQVNKACESIARLINALPEEVTAYPKNTTESIAMVLQGLPWKEGDEVIGANVDHTATYIPLLRLMKQKGIKFQMIKADPHGWVDLKEYKKRINKKTKLITVCHASNIYGTILQAQAICDLARENGLLSMLDCAQTVGRMPVDVKKIGCDFLNICGRKHLCGPQGTAALYVKKDKIEMLEPVLTGGGAAVLVSDYEYKYLPGMLRHNAGILNTSGVIGLGVAVDYWQEIGMETIRRHNLELQETLFDGIEALGSTIFSPRKKEIQIGVISFLIKGVDPDFLIQELESKYKIIIRAGAPGSPVFRELGVNKVNRLASHYFTTREDVDQLLEAMREIRDRVRK